VSTWALILWVSWSPTQNYLTRVADYNTRDACEEAAKKMKLILQHHLKSFTCMEKKS
jgi:hypothetical protein